MVEFYNAPRDLYMISDAMAHIAVIKSFEEDKYSEIPKWDGEVLHWSTAAVLLHFTRVQRPSAENWFPYSTLRKTEDGLSIYAANWLIDRKGL